MNKVCTIFGLNYEWSYILYIDGRMAKCGMLRAERFDDAQIEAAGMFPGVTVERGLC